MNNLALRTIMEKKLASAVAVAVLPFLLLGCAIHPLPENVTGLNTYQIVNKIRCEARKAVKERAIQLLLEDNNVRLDVREKWAKFLDAHAELWREIPLREKFSRKTLDLIDRYDDALIHLDFTLRISEENNISSEVNFLSAVTAGTSSFGIKASNNRSRKNTRNFRVKDSFAKLLTARLTCHGISEGRDYFYPITGEIGLKEVIWTFLDLNELQNLSKGDSPNLFTDTLVFNTTLVGSGNPKVLLSSVGKALNLASAEFTSEARRIDEHEVLIGLALPDEKAAIAGQAGALTGDAVPVPLLPSSRLGVSTDRSLHGYQLDQLMNFQLERNALLNLRDSRQINLSIFP